MISYLFFSVWLSSLNMIIFKSIHVAASGIISFFLKAEWQSLGYIYHIFLIHSSADGHLDCFHVLAIVRSAGINTGVHVSFWIVILSGYVPSSGIAESYGNSTFGFWGTSILHTVFHNGRTNSHLSAWYLCVCVCVCVCVYLSILAPTRGCLQHNNWSWHMMEKVLPSSSSAVP